MFAAWRISRLKNVELPFCHDGQKSRWFAPRLPASAHELLVKSIPFNCSFIDFHHTSSRLVGYDIHTGIETVQLTRRIDTLYTFGKMGDAEITASQWKNVEVGRVALFSDGPYEGRLAAIVQIIDHKRVRLASTTIQPFRSQPKHKPRIKDPILTPHPLL